MSKNVVPTPTSPSSPAAPAASAALVLESAPLGFPWATVDPFLFCAHHDDHYPAGDAELGVDAKYLAGRKMGMDFEVRDGFRMYHGEHVPGFPHHPHRGFETVTLVRKGYCDHADSLGAAARFGAGDAQWITTGSGIVHSEMFPLLRNDQENQTELFQIWLNLPSQSKMVPAHFAMLWQDDIPRVEMTDDRGRKSTVTVVAGALDGRVAPPPPPHSWAADPAHDVAIWTIHLEAGARVTLPPAHSKSHRALYFFEGTGLKIGEQAVDPYSVSLVVPDAPLVLEAGDAAVQILLLQGKPIGQPVAQHGPFVMNTRAELAQAFQDYQKTQFGGWPWPADWQAHDKTRGRFVRMPDGTEKDLPLVPGADE